MDPSARAPASAERSAELRPEPEDLTFSAICDAAVRLASPPSKIEELNTDIMFGVVVEGVFRYPSAVVRGAWSVGSATHPEDIFLSRDGFWRIAMNLRRVRAHRTRRGRNRRRDADGFAMKSLSSRERARSERIRPKLPVRARGGRRVGGTDVTSAFSHPREKNRETTDSPRVAIDAARRTDRIGCTER